jgi:Ca2+-binding EF-hand superfamily protein
MASNVSGGAAPERVGANSLLAARIRINELFVTWLASEEGSEIVNVIVTENLAAARQPPQPLDNISLERQDSGSTSSALPSPAGHYDPHTPSTPPNPRHHARPVGPSAQTAIPSSEPTSPARYLGVDEIDMRGGSPGGASPVSPNHAVTRSVVDPHLPRSPETATRLAAGRRTGAGFVNDLDLSGSMSHTSPPIPLAAATASASASASRAASPVGNYGGFAPTVAGYDEIPRFHRVRKGQIVGGAQGVDGVEDELLNLDHIFSSTPGARRPLATTNRRLAEAQVDLTKGLKRSNFESVCTEVFRVPAWMRGLLFTRILKAVGLPDNGPSTLLRYAEIKRYYQASMMHLTPNRRLFELIRSPESRREFLTVEELALAAKQIVSLHKCLEFLTQAEFQELYCKTVATRIVYHHERRQSRTVEWADFDKSDVPTLMRSLDMVTDINQVLRYFSYEHFYVLYCRFWELDTDKTHHVNLQQMRHYGGGGLTARVLERVVEGRGHRLVNPRRKELEFEDFVYFCLSEEDKNSLAAKRYWFNVVDIDADGIISGHEMEYFFEEQIPRFEELATDDLRYDDMLCQMLDMFVPELSHRQGITFADIRNCETAEHFFNMLFNAQKFWAFEHRDPFGEHQQRQAVEKTAWDRFARAEYDRMASEAGQ